MFRAKRADRIKLVYFDGTGVCLLAVQQVANHLES
ncbi:MAG: transposase [Mesorhizobium sp.]|nr:MAG: transposase [Mesorhizobium sp.]